MLDLKAIRREPEPVREALARRRDGSDARLDRALELDTLRLELLPQVEPALTEWAAYFAAGAGKRAAAEAGLPRAASAREADNLVRDAETFLSLAETALGVEVQSPLPLRPAG